MLSICKSNKHLKFWIFISPAADEMLVVYVRVWMCDIIGVCLMDGFRCKYAWVVFCCDTPLPHLVIRTCSVFSFFFS